MLLPVDGEMFCLQCGQSEHVAPATNGEEPKSEDTTDPLLKRALLDATDGDIVFNDTAGALELVPPGAGAAHRPAPAGVAAVEGVAQKKPGHTFLSLRAVMAAPRPSATNGAIVLPAAVPMPPPAAIPDPESARSAQTAESVTPRASTGARVVDKGMAKAWGIGLAGLGLFIGFNLAAGGFYSNRVYPGVRVDNLAVGGWTFDELHQKLQQTLPKPALSAVVGAGHYELNLSDAGYAVSADLERNLRESGRMTPLPLAGLIGSWFTKPISPAYVLGDDAVDRSVQRLAAAVERTPSNAAAMIHGTDVFVLADKPGVRLDRAATAAAIRAAYGHVATVSINPLRLQPSVGASDYANDATLAQAIITTTIQITVRKAHYSPTPGQIASWVVFLGPGKGVVVDPAGVAVFVATIPGSFDRIGTVNGVVAVLNARQGAILSPSTKKSTPGPNPASMAMVGPVASYSYCIDETAVAVPELAQTAAAVLGSGGSWTLGGKLRFVQAKTGCNFTVRLANASALAALNSACEHQTTCRIHNDLAIATDSWSKAPSIWVGDTTVYRSELINHVVGQWLGFEHPSCSAAATLASVLTTPSLTIGGCSPKWYAVPAELQDTKVMPGF